VSRRRPILCGTILGATFEVELRPLGGFPSPAAARHLEVYMSGLNSLSEGRHGAVFSSPGVPEPDKMAPLEVGLPRGPQGRAFELKVPIIYVNCLRSFNIGGCWEPVGPGPNQE
jgi:hypothetical protein